VADQVLTEDEKNALLDGVTSGAVRVQANGGPTYASVRPFDIRARIVSNSFPRLQTINQRFAEQLSRQAEKLLQCDVEVRPLELNLRASSGSPSLSGSGVAVVFQAAPLTGSALILLRPELVGHLVEAFFGGPGNVASGTGSGSFSAGELSVSNLFANLVLATVQDAWQPLVAFSPTRTSTETSLDHIELPGDCDSIIDASFELALTADQADHRGQFHILWPRDMVEPLLPAFEGRKRERDSAADAQWVKQMRRRLAEVPMKVSTRVGHASLALGDVIALAPGDVISIGSPKRATVLANGVPIINGRFGVFDGRNAVEAGEWLSPGSAAHLPKDG